MTAGSDKTLVLAAMEGDVDSFIALCRQYYPTMVTVAFAILHDHHLAEDAVQEAFAKACRSLSNLKSPSRFGPWLTTICRNEAKTVWRRMPKAESLGDRDVSAKVDEPNDVVGFVSAAIKTLSTDARELIYLKYRRDLSHEAIAKLLDITPAAVHGRLQRARKAIKQHLENTTNRRIS